jgi:hypothetical protein
VTWRPNRVRDFIRAAFVVMVSATLRSSARPIDVPIDFSESRAPEITNVSDDSQRLQQAIADAEEVARMSPFEQEIAEAFRMVEEARMSLAERGCAWPPHAFRELFAHAFDDTSRLEREVRAHEARMRADRHDRCESGLLDR